MAFPSKMTLFDRSGSIRDEGMQVMRDWSGFRLFRRVLGEHEMSEI